MELEFIQNYFSSRDQIAYELDYISIYKTSRTIIRKPHILVRILNYFHNLTCRFVYFSFKPCVCIVFVWMSLIPLRLNLFMWKFLYSSALPCCVISVAIWSKKRHQMIKQKLARGGCFQEPRGHHLTYNYSKILSWWGMHTYNIIMINYNLYVIMVKIN